MSDATKALSHVLGLGLFPQPEAGKCLFLQAEESSDFSDGWRRAFVCEQSFKPAYDALQRAGYGVEREVSGAGFDLALCLLTKHKAENLANLARGWLALRPGGTLVCAGGKEVGAPSIERAFRTVVEGGSLSKHHCRVFWGTRTGDVPAEIAAWADSGRMQVAPETGFWSRPGLYNWNKVDRGSALLVDHLPRDIKGRVADLGGGWGYLSLKLLERCPGIATLDLFEAEWRALEAAKANLAHAPTIHFHWHDVAAGLPEKAFDAIVMNPPFHEGKAVDVDLGRAFITSASQALVRGGRLFLVANRQLPYETALATHFKSVQTLSENALYKVIAATR